MESKWKNMGINLGWNAGINDIMVVDSIIMTTCMSPFSKPFLDFELMQKFPPSQTCHFTNAILTSLYEAISPSKWLWLELLCPTNHNANMHNLDLSCFYL